jgi:hypothetical protein
MKHYYDSDQGAMVELEDDVLGIVRQIHELYDQRIAVNLDPITGWFHITEHCEDGTERLIFSTDVLDGRTLERLQKADSQWRHYEDSYDRSEREQDEAQAEIDARYRDRLFEEGERLLHVMKRSGLSPRIPLRLPMRMRRDHK